MQLELIWPVSARLITDQDLGRSRCSCFSFPVLLHLIPLSYSSFSLLPCALQGTAGSARKDCITRSGGYDGRRRRLGPHARS